MRYLISVDAGTTCFKAGLYDESLRPVRFASEEYTLQYLPEGFVEFPAEEYYKMLCRLVRSLLKESGVAGEAVAGLSFSSQGETMVCMGADGTPIHNAIIWTDGRAPEQADRLTARFGADRIFAVTGQREVTPALPAPKILWMKENRPEIFAKTARYLLLTDYLIYRLTGEYVSDYSLSTSTLYMDIRSDCWWPEMLEALSITPEQLPRLIPCGSPVGTLTAEAASETGLTQAIVSGGAFDQVACMLGAGNVKAGMVTETTGTCLAVCANVGNAHQELKEGTLPVHRGILPNSYYTIYWSPAAGSIYRWLRELLFADSNEKGLFRRMDEEAEVVPAGSEGLILLPYLSGRNYPSADETAKGVFTGIDYRHRRGHFLRAALESVSFLLQESLGELTSFGIIPGEIYSLGGGATSRLWCQIKADVTGCRIKTLSDNEVGCLGGAILAAAGCGLVSDIAEAAQKACTVTKEYSPDPSNGATYGKAYSVFCEESGLYAQSKELRKAR